MLTQHPEAIAIAAVLLAVWSWLSPVWTMAAILAMLPLFLQHPASSLTHWFVALVALVELSCLVRALPRWRRAWSAVSNQPILLLALLFVTAAFLSLSALPLSGIWAEHAAARSGDPVGGISGFVGAWLGLTETRREFSITSALLTLQAFVFAVIVWQETRRSTRAAVRLASAITLGVVVFTVLGLFELFGVLDLDNLRATTLATVRPGTLQGPAGNPGWYSQYLVYAMPYGLVLLAYGRVTGAGVARLIAVTALTAFGVLVCFQRGGWMSGSVVVGFLALVLALLPRPGGDAGGSARARFVPALVLTALVGATVIGGGWIWLARARATGSAFDVDAYIARFESIAQADRLVYAQAGWKVAVLHPILGGGHESFAYLYQRYFTWPGGPYYGSPIRVPEAASAHSVYFQTLTGTGAVGLALLLAMFVTAGVAVTRVLRSAETDWSRRVVLLAASGSLLGIAVYGFVQEVFYIHALRLLFFANLGIVAGLTTDVLRWPAGVRRSLWLALAVAFVLHLAYEYVSPGPDRLLRSGQPTGLYGEERGPAGSRFRWSSDWSSWPVPAGATGYSLRVRSVAPFPQDAEVQACHGATMRLALADHDWHDVRGAIEGCPGGGHLELRVSPAWRPPGDGRLLGVMASDVAIE